MRTRVSVSPSWTAPARDVEIEGEAGADLASVLASVRTAGGWQGTVVSTDGVVPESGPWESAAALLPGQRLVISSQDAAGGHTTPAGPGPRTGWLLIVTAGPAAGHAYPVGLRSVVGRGRVADLVVDDPELSRRHVELRVNGAVVEIRDLGSTNGSHIAGTRLGPEWTLLPPDATIKAGLSEFRVEREHGTPARLIPKDLRLELVESARTMDPPVTALRLSWPTRPAVERRATIPWVVFLLPLVFSVGVAVWRQSPDALIFGLLTPVSLLGNWWYQRGESRGRSSEDTARYERSVDRVRDEVARATVAERDRLLALHPSPAEAVDIGLRRLTRLWERRRDHEDFAVLRIGVGVRPAAIDITYPPDEVGEQPRLEAAPITVALRAGTVLGVSGTGPAAAALHRWIVTQLAVAHSPDLLPIAVLGAPLVQEEWGSARWLPHVAAEWLLGNDADRSAAIADRLGSSMARGSIEPGFAPAGSPNPAPRAVVLLTNAAELRRQPAVARLLARADELGLAVVCLADEPRRLPPECRTVIHVDGDVATMTGDSTASPFRAERVSAEAFDGVCRSLAPLVAPSPGSGAQAALPDLVRLDDLLHGPTRDLEAMRALWATKAVRGPIAVTAQGPFVLDLAEQGPHALVAGAPGSGKSEFLRTAVTSLAANADPESVSFVFIDYKGDSSFRVLKGLPHCVGFVTDLDESGAARALVSFGAEVKRRSELITVRAAADDIDGYRAYRRRHPDLPPLPRLIIMVDEFARLKQNMPEFINGLVEIAQVGRSLGMHLVMATQRPAGNISDQIRACVDLTVCLRTATESESRDVIGTPEAAHLPKTSRGRALIRVGGGSAVLAQTASSTWTSVAAAATVSAEVLRWWQPSSPPKPEPLEGDDTDDASAATVFRGEAPEAERVVRMARQLWDALGGQPLHRPWLEPLPVTLTVDALAPTSEDVALRIGLLDQPQRQAQASLTWPLANGHLAIVGGLRSGRTTAIRSFVADLADRTTPDDVHVHVIDGGGALGSLAQLPHVGVVVHRGQTERLIRLLDLLDAEIAARRARYAAGNLGSLAHQRAGSGTHDPYLLIAVDRWDSFTDADPRAELTPRLARLLTDGSEVGLVVMVTGDERFGASAALAQRMRAVLALRVSDPTAALVPGLGPRNLSATSVPGRAVWSPSLQEVQIPLLSPRDDAPAQNTAVAAIAERARARSAGAAARTAPVRIDALPDALTLAEAGMLPTQGTGPILCVGGNTLVAHRWDVGGPDRVVQVLGRPPASHDVAAMVATQVLASGGAVWWRGSGSPPGATEVAPSASLAETVSGCRPTDLLVLTILDGLAPDALSTLVGGGPAMLIVSLLGALPGQALQAVAGRIRTHVVLAPTSRLELSADLAGALEPGFRLDGPPGRALLLRDRQPAVVQIPVA